MMEVTRHRYLLDHNYYLRGLVVRSSGGIEVTSIGV